MSLRKEPIYRGSLAEAGLGVVEVLVGGVILEAEAISGAEAIPEEEAGSAGIEAASQKNRKLEKMRRLVSRIDELFFLYSFC